MHLTDLLQLSAGYWSTCALHAGVKLDLFTHLAEQPLSSAELAERIDADRRGLEMLLNALVALQLLHKEQDRYRATSCSAQYLSRTSDSYQGHIIQHHHHLVDSWRRLDESVKTGAPVRSRLSHDADEKERESFLMGMFNLASLNAPRIAAALDLTGRCRMLDLAGGPGTYAVHFCRQHPTLSAVVFDLPTTRPFAEQIINRFGLAGRISFRAGDVTVDDLGGGYDLIWVSHLLHSESPAAGAAIIARAAQTLDPGGMLLIQEFILDESRTAPLFPALFSLNMLVNTPAGQSYSEQELTSLMTAAGLSQVRRIPLDLPNGAGVMAGFAG